MKPEVNPESNLGYTSQAQLSEYAEAQGYERRTASRLYNHLAIIGRIPNIDQSDIWYGIAGPETEWSDGMLINVDTLDRSIEKNWLERVPNIGRTTLSLATRFVEDRKSFLGYKVQ